MSPLSSFALAGYIDCAPPTPSPMHTASGSRMKQSSRKSTTVVVEDRTVVAERLSAFLRAKHPFKTADNVAADTGIGAATVARWLDRGSTPRMESLSQLVGAYGSEVLCVILDRPPPALVAAARQEERERVEGQIASLRARIDGAPL